MSATAGKFNLRPQERRLVALVGIVVFVVLNIWLIWPHFGDWADTKNRMAKAEKDLAKYDAEIAKMKAYQVKLRELEAAGPIVLPEEQDLDLVRKVDTQARMNGLQVISFDPRPRVSNSPTNHFFEEQYETIHVTCDNESLINFLVSLTSSNSLIRVKDLTLRVADATALKLDGSMTLVASYQRSTPARGQPQTARPATTVPVASKTNKPLPAASSNLAKTNKPGSAPPPLIPTNKITGPKTRQIPQTTKK